MLRHGSRPVLKTLVALLAALVGVALMPATALADPYPELPVDGPAVEVALATPGQASGLVFTAEGGRRLVIGTPAVTATPGTGRITLTVVGPDGAQVLSARVTAGWGAIVDAPAEGEHEVIVTPDAGVTGTVSVQLRSAADPDPAVLPDDGTVVTSTLAAGQNRTLTFAAQAGQRFRLRTPEVVANGRVRLVLTAPDGSRPLDGTAATSNLEWILESAQEGGYTLLIDPDGLTAGTVSARLETVTDLPTAPLEIDGPLLHTSFPVSGQDRTLELTTVADRRVRLVMPAVSANGRIRVLVTAPDGTAVVNGTAASNAVWLLEPTQEGVYRIQIAPDGITTGAVDLRAESVRADTEDVVDVDGEDVVTTMSRAGENAWISFEGEAGQRYRILTPTVTNTGRTRITLTAPDGTTELSGTAASGGVWLLETVQQGTYRMYVDPDGVSTATVSWRLQSVNDLAEARLRIDGAATTSVFAAAGANRTLTFTGQPGGRLRLSVPAASASPNGRISMTVTQPDGTPMLTVPARVDTPGGPWVLELTQAGVHRVTLDPRGTTTGSVSLLARTVRDLPDAELVPGGPAVASTFQAGENRTLTLAATAGQSLRVSVPASTVGRDLRLTVFSPTGKQLSAAAAPQGYAYTITAALAGTYRLQLDPLGVATGTAEVRAEQLPAR